MSIFFTSSRRSEWDWLLLSRKRREWGTRLIHDCVSLYLLDESRQEGFNFMASPSQPLLDLNGLGVHFCCCSQLRPTLGEKQANLSNSYIYWLRIREFRSSTKRFLRIQLCTFAKVTWIASYYADPKFQFENFNRNC